MWAKEDLLKLYDNRPDPRTDNQKIDYDKKKYDWSGWVLETIQEIRPALEKLEDVHLHFKTSELVELRKHLEKLTNSKEFSQKLDQFLLEYISPIIDRDDFLVQSTCGIRMVVPNQANLGRLLNFHTGYWTGYSDNMTTCWVPLTRAYESNTMQVVSWEDTVPLMKKIYDEKLNMSEIEKLCVEKAYPVNLDPGQAWLFNQAELHGNINNETGVSRLSFDVRWALPEGSFGIRRAGSFFRFLGTHYELDENRINKNIPWITFIDQNSEYIGLTPHFMIREFMTNYVSKYKLNIVEWANALWYLGGWSPNLLHLINQDNELGIIMPSVHCLSCDVDRRMEIFKLAIDKGIQILFCDENILLDNAKDLDLIEKIYNLET